MVHYCDEMQRDAEIFKSIANDLKKLEYSIGRLPEEVRAIIRQSKLETERDARDRFQFDLMVRVCKDGHSAFEVQNEEVAQVYDGQGGYRPMVLKKSQLRCSKCGTAL